MKVRCDARNICKGKHIAIDNICPHYNFHEYEFSDCCGYCGAANSVVMCEEPTRKDKLERLKKINEGTL